MKQNASFFGKISQDTLHVKRCLESCCTDEQLENSRLFCEGLIERWRFNYSLLNKKEKLKNADAIDVMIRDIQQVYNVKYQEIQEINQQKNVQNIVVVSGFC